MHILVTNDDGPPSNQSSPYVHSLVTSLQSAGHTVSVILPHVQRSWIGKAHMVGETLTPTYFRPGTLHQDDGQVSDTPFNEGEQWVLLDGTPASCAQIGIHHLFKDRGPIDLVVSGPNYGRNTTAVFAMSSGTIGGAMEAAVMGKKAIALSYAFDSREHVPKIIAAASKLSTKLIEKFAAEWPEDVHIYSINVPLRKGVGSTKIVYTDMLQNMWTSGSSFTELPADADDADPNMEEARIRDGKDMAQSTNSQGSKTSRVTYKWSPNFTDVKEAVEKAGKGDGWHVTQGHVTVTPLRANFWHLPHYSGEIKLNTTEVTQTSPGQAAWDHTVYALVDYPDPYVQPLFVNALELFSQLPIKFIDTLAEMPKNSCPLVQFTAYEAIAFDFAAKHPANAQICAYMIRKALIRKHYLSNTISTWLVKHSDSLLKSSFKPCVHFELDYAEFLDEALVDAWDLQESMARNESCDANQGKEWWILKPGMSDGGNGIRLFSSMDQLQAIFEEWEPESDDEEDDDNDADADADSKEAQQSPTHDQEDDTAMTSQLRHFIAQPYIDRPLLLEDYGSRKFHIRTYVLAVGSLKVFVYREMLALFAARPYQSPNHSEDTQGPDLGKHLTNTCFQNESTRSTSVHSFWDLKVPSLDSHWQESVFSQICAITGEVFEAAAKEQMIHFQTLPNAFEVFGVDFLVDAKQNVYLLELNAYPDFKQTGQDLQNRVIGGLFEEVVKVAVAPFFGVKLFETGSERMVSVKHIDLGRK